MAETCNFGFGLSAKILFRLPTILRAGDELAYLRGGLEDAGVEAGGVDVGDVHVGTALHVEALGAVEPVVRVMRVMSAESTQ